MVRWFFRLNLMLSLCVWALAFGAYTWAAGNLKIETRTTSRVSGDLLTIRVVYTNKGSAPAHRLQVHLDTLGVEEHASIIPQLNPSESDTVTFERDIQGLGKGRYPLVISVDFHDENQYPFTALSGMTFHKEVDVNPQLITRSRDVTIQGEGKLRFKIKNLAAVPRHIGATLYIPKEFSTPEIRDTFTIGAKAEKNLNFDVSNFSALPGSAYPVFCALEYKAEDTHHTAFARLVVKIAEDGNLFRRFRWLWIALIGILALCLVVAVARDRKRKT